MRNRFHEVRFRRSRALCSRQHGLYVVSAPEAASLSEEGARADQKAGWPPQCRHVVGCRARKPNSHDLGIGIGLLVGGWVLLIPAILILLQAAVAALIAANTAMGG